MNDQTAEGCGFRCWDCETSILRPDHLRARRDAEAEGWKVIRGVDRCPGCAAVDDAARAGVASQADEIARRLRAGQTLSWKPSRPDEGGVFLESEVRVTHAAIMEHKARCYAKQRQEIANG